MALARTRLSREERKAQTRRLLLEAAAEVFASKGFAGGLLAEVAERAGFTIGAVYSNFASKEDLFLALLDEHLAGHADRVAEILEGPAPTPAERLHALSRYLEEVSDTDRAWRLLSLEFFLHAARNQDLRPRLAAHLRRFRAAIAALVERRFEEMGLAATARDRVATSAVALVEGLLLQRLLDPASVTREDFEAALGWLLSGAAVAGGLSLEVAHEHH